MSEVFLTDSASAKETAKYDYAPLGREGHRKRKKEVAARRREPNERGKRARESDRRKGSVGWERSDREIEIHNRKAEGEIVEKREDERGEISTSVRGKECRRREPGGERGGGSNGVVTDPISGDYVLAPSEDAVDKPAGEGYRRTRCYLGRQRHGRTTLWPQSGTSADLGRAGPVEMRQGG